MMRVLYACVELDTAILPDIAHLFRMMEGVATFEIAYYSVCHGDKSLVWPAGSSRIEKVLGKLPNCTITHCIDEQELAESCGLSDSEYVVMMSSQHEMSDQLLSQALKNKFGGYISTRQTDYSILVGLNSLLSSVLHTDLTDGKNLTDYLLQRLDEISNSLAVYEVELPLKNSGGDALKGCVEVKSPVHNQTISGSNFLLDVRVDANITDIHKVLFFYGGRRFEYRQDDFVSRVYNRNCITLRKTIDVSSLQGGVDALVVVVGANGGVSFQSKLKLYCPQYPEVPAAVPLPAASDTSRWSVV
jgi:hypothetical protein